MKWFLICLILIISLKNSESAQPCNTTESNFAGECLNVYLCKGAVLIGNCPTNSFCCVSENKKTPKDENSILTESIFLNIVGNTARNKYLYNYVAESMKIANIEDEYQIAAYLSQIIGETNYFKSLESTQIEKDYDNRTGNNQVGDGIKYKGRGIFTINLFVKNLIYNIRLKKCHKNQKC